MIVLKKWEDLPEFMRTEEVKPYWEVLNRKKATLVLKRMFDLIVSSVLLAVLAIPMLAIAFWIKLDSPGPVFYRQERVTIYGRHFMIHKFRSMVDKADMKGTTVTVKNDCRITKSGKFIRKYRLDEFGQLFDVLGGNMTFVGTRPEVPKYVEGYTPEMMATLLLPAGVTSLASIYYKDEAELLADVEDADKIYVNEVLPAKMNYNLEELREYGFWKDIWIMVKTVKAVMVGEEK